MSVWCQICKELKSCTNATQLVPCLHTFCNPCIAEVSKTSKVCPATHCYSPIVAPDSFIGICEVGNFFVVVVTFSKTQFSAEKCIKKIAIASDTFRTVCHHEICQYCFDMASRKDKLSCPVYGCGEPMLDDEELLCDGPCRRPLFYNKTIVQPCCGARLCLECAQSATSGKDFCEPGKCVTKEPTKKKKAVDLSKQSCQGCVGCDGEVLRNFPSEYECEHDVCIGCISVMLDECEKSNRSPFCPNKGCNIPYRCDSVLALRALFPEREKFFSKFTLSVHFSMQVLKDDTITEIQLNDAIDMEQKFSLKVCFCEDEENGVNINYVKDGSLGDLIREIRRVLKILSTDKIYGYYRKDGESGNTTLEVSAKTIKKTAAEMNINENTVILVDISGIVACQTKK
ncbi:unnamed protein product [Caenorhabditis bovis]|uniref:RING-type domain-containing protein n=1 Tax=Caenorhabditis bovis TaxID=2654633 RepID=A0A8S1E540_9PELO|nr:unnamed protein product [Caenorhabditis bovis]